MQNRHPSKNQNGMENGLVCVYLFIYLEGGGLIIIIPNGDGEITSNTGSGMSVKAHVRCT